MAVSSETSVCIYQITWRHFPQGRNFNIDRCEKRKFKWSTIEHLKLGFEEPQGSANGCRGLRETKMRNGETVWLALRSFYVQIKIPVTSPEADHSATDGTQSIHRCFKPEASWCSSPLSQQLAKDSPCVRRNDQVINYQFEVSRSYFTCNVHKDKQTQVFNFTLELL